MAARPSELLGAPRLRSSSPQEARHRPRPLRPERHSACMQKTCRWWSPSAATIFWARRMEGRRTLKARSSFGPVSSRPAADAVIVKSDRMRTACAPLGPREAVVIPTRGLRALPPMDKLAAGRDSASIREEICSFRGIPERRSSDSISPEGGRTAPREFLRSGDLALHRNPGRVPCT